LQRPFFFTPDALLKSCLPMQGGATIHTDRALRGISLIHPAIARFFSFPAIVLNQEKPILSASSIQFARLTADSPSAVWL